MNHPIKKRSCIIIFLAILLITFFESPSTGKQGFKETVIAGGPDKFAEVRHIIMRGSNFEIGQQIGELAKKDGTPVIPSDDYIMNRAKREYMAKNYPILHERMKGVAAAYRLNFLDDSYDFSGLFQPPMAPPGCSVTFYPAEHTENGHNILSRNYDFTTGDLRGKNPQKASWP